MPTTSMTRHPEQRQRFLGKVAVVTGAARGIGSAIARALGKEGAALVLADLDHEALRNVAEDLAKARVRVVWTHCDVRRRADVERLADVAYRELQRVDFLVNNAGLYPVTPFFSLTEDEWDLVVDTNLKGPFLCTQAIARRMVEQRVAGRVVNISSTASQVARPGIAHYGSSKAALNQLTRILAIELAPYGIAVNAVSPGVIATERVLAGASGAHGAAEHRAKLGRTPLRRAGTPEEVAAAVLFLLSDEASYCTGAVLFADGGYSLGLANYEG